MLIQEYPTNIQLIRSRVLNYASIMRPKQVCELISTIGYCVEDIRHRGTCIGSVEKIGGTKVGCKAKESVIYRIAITTPRHGLAKCIIAKK